MSRVRHIFRWDLDKTYLKTEFDTVRDLWRTARIPAELRQNIPGSAALIRAIRDCAPDGYQHLVFFISGSPQQLRTVIERKFALDGFVPDGFVLKPTVRNFLRGRFRAIRGQVAFKLAELLAGRAEAPIGTEETLFGDDAENDAYIYSLYADLIAGRVTPQELREILKKAGAYSDQIREIEEGLEAIVHERPVKRIIIHLDRRTPPAAFQVYFPLVVPIYNHLQTAIVLYLDDTLGPEAIRLVGRELIEAYGFDVQKLSNLAEDILRRIRLRYPLGHLDRLANDLMKLPALDPRSLRPVNGMELKASTDGQAPAEPEPDPERALLVEAGTTQLISAIAERATYLKGRPLPESASSPPEKRDYLALFELELARKEEIKRLRKLAARSSRSESAETLETT